MEIAQEVPSSVKIGPWYMCLCAYVRVPTDMRVHALLRA